MDTIKEDAHNHWLRNIRAKNLTAGFDRNKILSEVIKHLPEYVSDSE